VWYLVLARNECGEVGLVDEYFGVTVQKLCSEKEQVTGPDAISAVALKPCLHQHVFFLKKCSLPLLLNTIFKLEPIWFFFKFGLRNFSITLYNGGIITSRFLLERDDDDDDNNNSNNNNNWVFGTVTSVHVLGIGRILKLSKFPVFIKPVTFSSTVCAASFECKQHGSYSRARTVVVKRQ